MSILEQEGRKGDWYTYNDATVGAPNSLDSEPGGPAETGATFSYHFSGSGFTSWGAGIGLKLADGAQYDASKYAGISFWARVEDGSATALRVNLPDVSTSDAGQVCTSCYSHFGADVALSTTWQQFTFTWQQLRQQDWGDQFNTISATKLYGIEFLFPANATFDLWVTNVSFFGTGTPGAPENVVPEVPTSLGIGGQAGMPSFGDAPVDSPVALHGALKVQGTQLVDAQAEPLQLRGVSSMWLNWESKPFAESPELLSWLQDTWGLTVFRAAMGVEPAGAYLSNPKKALGQLDTIVKNAVDLGVYVIIDWHDHNAAKHPELAEEFFGYVSERYAGLPNVIYETFNEPLQVSWPNVLKPYHERMVAAIRAHAPEAVIVLGTPTWSQDVDKAALAPLAGTNLMYTLHFYSCTHGQWLIDKANTALGLGLPLFVTEWGATASDGGLDGVVCEEPTTLWTDWMKAKGVSWAAWKLDTCNPDASCLLTPGTAAAGPFTEDALHGHAALVRSKMLE